MTGATTDDLVVVGRIRRAHGLLGVLVVEPMTASAELVFAAGRDLIAAR
jgi:ribosomal 30S subunit maturation factor RimM